jgi:hypothetical protein
MAISGHSKQIAIETVFIGFSFREPKIQRREVNVVLDRGVTEVRSGDSHRTYLVFSEI